jgi:hypothetical protein
MRDDKIGSNSDDGKPASDEPGVMKVCAAERAAESLAQPKEARRDASGPSDLPENESWRGKEHIGEAGVTGRRRRCRPARPVRYGES